MRYLRILPALLVTFATASLSPTPAAAYTPAGVRSARVTATAPAHAAGVDRSGPYGSARHTGSASVALTFDDGPDPRYTVKLLNLLKSQHVKATFCVVGQEVRRHPAIIRRMIAEGHTLCNHSWRHRQDLGRLSAAGIRRDLRATTAAIRRAAPRAQIRYFRAPYGNWTARLTRISRDLGMTPVGWSVDDQAWQTARYGRGTGMVRHMVSLVKRDTHRGSIVLSHDLAKPWTITAYRTLLPWLRHRFKLIALPIPTAGARTSGRPAPSAHPGPAPRP